MEKEREKLKNILIMVDGKKHFEGEYLNDEKNGKGREYDKNGKLSFDGEYLKGKKWNGDEHVFFFGRVYEYRNGERYETYNRKYLFYCSII